MEKDLLLRLEALERTVRTLDVKVSQLEVLIANMQVNGPYSGNAFRSPAGNPFQYQPAVSVMNPPTLGQSPVQHVQNINSIEQKLDRLLELFNNNFSRLNFRLEALENERRE